LKISAPPDLNTSSKVALSFLYQLVRRMLGLVRDHRNDALSNWTAGAARQCGAPLPAIHTSTGSD